jgi:ribonucleoside-diphosphate reductase alpha chain
MKSGAHRERMPNKRQSSVHSYSIEGYEVVVTLGKYPDGDIGEVFIDLGKEGSDVAGWANSFAIALSLGLQHGIPADKFCHTFKDLKFGHKGYTEIGNVTSVPDLVMKAIEREVACG